MCTAIGYTLSMTPRDNKYKHYKPGLVIFNDYHDSCSRKHSQNSIHRVLCQTSRTFISQSSTPPKAETTISRPSMRISKTAPSCT